MKENVFYNSLDCIYCDIDITQMAACVHVSCKKTLVDVFSYKHAIHQCYMFVI